MHLTLSVKSFVNSKLCYQPCQTASFPVQPKPAPVWPLVQLIIRDSEESAVSLASIKIASGRDMPVNYPIEKVELGEVRGQGKLAASA